MAITRPMIELEVSLLLTGKNAVSIESRVGANFAASCITFSHLYATRSCFFVLLSTDDTLFEHKAAATSSLTMFPIVIISGEKYSESLQS